MEETVQLASEWDFGPSIVTVEKDEETEEITGLKKALV
jgi:hypothetical protein